MLDPTPAQRRAIERHLDELDVWNRRLNLTTVLREQAWTRHVEESLRLLTLADPPPGSRCADLGSGGGIPGVIVAIVRPDVAMTLIEADQRKAGFLMHICGLLELGNATVAARRAEEMGGDAEHREAYDAVVSRAAAPALRLFALARPLLRPGGTLFALVSDNDAAAAVTALAADASLAAEHPVPGVLVVRRAVRG